MPSSVDRVFSVRQWSLSLVAMWFPGNGPPADATDGEWEMNVNTRSRILM
jgi:hypothetical protein